MFKKEKTKDKNILEKIEKNQQKIIKVLEDISESIVRLEKEQSEVKKISLESLRNTVILYGKSLLTRLNFVELSNNLPVSVSENEKIEIENSKKSSPDPEIFMLPKLYKSDRVKKRLN